MGAGRQMIWLAQVLSLCALAWANCVTLKDSTTRQESYMNCEQIQYYGCRQDTRTVVIGPVIYLCSNVASVSVINAKLTTTTVEKIMLVKEANLGSLEPNGYSWQNLTTLSMDNANVTRIVPGFFNNFQDLQSLELTNNVYLEFIIDGVFSSLSKLDKLNLSANAIKSVTDHTFSGLMNLKILDLSNNRLTSIPQNIFNYQPFLQYVNFSQNSLVNVNYAFTLPDAQMINLSKNKLGEFDFKQLEASAELHVVDISENLIENVTNLNYTCIERLNLAFNKVKELGEVIGVVELTLSHNKLQNLSNSEFDSNLEYLDLGFNEISQATAHSFQNASNLKQLHLEHNNIQVLPTDLLLNQRNLEYFNISHNKIAQIPFGLFSNVKNVHILDVSNNKMVLDIDTLFVLTNLETLYFQNNNVKNFDPKTLLASFKYLKHIALSDDLWNCNELAKTVHLLEMEKVVVLRGKNTRTSNILGISCNDNAASKVEVIQLNIDEQNHTIINSLPPLTNYSENDALNSINKSISDLSTNLGTFLKSQNDYLNRSISDSSTNLGTFLKSQNDYLNRSISDSSTNLGTFLKSQNDYLNRSISDLSTNLGTFLKSQNDYLNRSISDVSTNLGTFLKSQNDYLNRSISDVSTNLGTFLKSQNDYLNRSVSDMSEQMKTTLDSQNNNLSLILLNLKSIFLSKPVAFPGGHQSKLTHEQIESNNNNNNYKTYNNAHLFVANSILILILCCILCHLYLHVRKLNLMRHAQQEQVQLL